MTWRNDPERRKKYAREYRRKKWKENPEWRASEKKRNQEFHKKNPEWRNEYMREWRNINSIQASKLQAKYERRRQMGWMEFLFEEGKPLVCEECGYRKNWAVIEFHHIDPATKTYKMSWFFQKKGLTDENKKTLLKDMESLQILCSNCHRELHNPDKSLEFLYDGVGRIPI